MLLLAGCSTAGPSRAPRFASQGEPAKSGSTPQQAASAPQDAPARAADPKPAWHPGKAELDVGQGLFGTLAPSQNRWLSERGLTFFGWYMIALQGNPVGGIRQDFDYAGLFDFGAELDMGKLAGLDDLTLHASGSWASGRDLSDDVSTFVPVNAVFSGDSLRFFELWAEQMWSHREWSLRLGRLSVGWEYGLDYDMFTQYLSAAFRLNVFALDANDVNFSVIPTSNWGTRVRWTPDDSWRFQASLMNGYPRNFADDSEHGLDWSFQPDEGLFLIGEGSYQWSTTEAQRERSGGLPGRVVLGAYADTGDFDRLDGSGNTADGLGTAYGIVRQKIYEPDDAAHRGVDLWTSLAFGWREAIAPVRFFWSGGMVWSGPFAAREHDSLALGYATSWFSSDLSGQSSETTFEGAYTFEVSSVLDVTGDVQYVVNPGGTGNIDDALLLGVLLYVTF